MPRPNINQCHVVAALQGLGAASRERIGVRLRLQGVQLESKQVGHALMHLRRKQAVRMVAGPSKGAGVLWELSPRELSPRELSPRELSPREVS